VLPYRIYSLETQVNQKHAHVDAESSQPLNGDADDPDKVFTNELETELERVVSFYALKENEIYAELNALLKIRSRLRSIRIAITKRIRMRHMGDRCAAAACSR
jgi:SPX domain protein involved in polyphosphate accumulation